MANASTEQRTVVVSRDVPARLVPDGTRITIHKNSFVNLRQALGGTYTVTLNGNMARIDGTDADAIGQAPLELDFDPPEADKSNAHIEIVDRHDIENTQIVLAAVNLFIPAHGLLQGAHGVLTFVEILFLHINSQRDLLPAGRGETVLELYQLTRY